MKAYKGFTSNLWSRLGDGQENNCSFDVGETKRVAESKTVRSGFHCCENPFDCLRYYSMDGKNRFFIVEASGDIDEDEHRIASTEITLVKELNRKEFALEGLKYMIEHPLREDWRCSHRNVDVVLDKAEATSAEAIAIARGSSPRVKGPAGSILGLIVEDEEGISNAKMIICTGAIANKWLSINENREVIEVEED